LLSVAAALMLSGCGGGGGMFDSSTPDASPGIGSRFSQIFGGNSQAVGEPSSPSQVSQNSQLICPPVTIRPGASTLAVGLPGKPASGTDLRYQVTITRTARDCNLQGGQITARIGIEGRVVVGPAGAPASVDIPLRVAVVQQGIHDKVIFTKFYRTSVAMPSDGGNATYNFVAEDVLYTAPTVDVQDSYLFYIGFDPNGMKPEPAPRARRGKTKS